MNTCYDHFYDPKQTIVRGSIADIPVVRSIADELAAYTPASKAKTEKMCSQDVLRLYGFNGRHCNKCAIYKPHSEYLTPHGRICADCKGKPKK